MVYADGSDGILHRFLGRDGHTLVPHRKELYISENNLHL
jgi:hypothetical protein